MNFYSSLYTKVSQTLRKLEDTCLLIFRPIVEYIGKFRTASEFMNFLNILARNAEWFRRDIRNISVQQQGRINLRPENLLRKVSSEWANAVSQERRMEGNINCLQRNRGISSFKFDRTFSSLLARSFSAGGNNFCKSLFDFFK